MSKLCYAYKAYVENCEATKWSGDLSGEEYLSKELISKGVESFTLTDVNGWYERKPKKSLEVLVYDLDNDPNLFTKLERALCIYCRVFDQECGLITREIVNYWYVTKDSY